jgi:hypothetical protein
MRCRKRGRKASGGWSEDLQLFYIQIRDKLKDNGPVIV